MIYVPIENISSNTCVEVLDTNILRYYHTTLVDHDNDYTDYNSSNHYSSYSSSIYLTSQPQCINYEDLTNQVYYRNDLSHILVCFFIMAIVIFYIPYKLFMRFYRKGR